MVEIKSGWLQSRYKTIPVRWAWFSLPKVFSDTTWRRVYIVTWSKERSKETSKEFVTWLSVQVLIMGPIPAVEFFTMFRVRCAETFLRENITEFSLVTDVRASSRDPFEEEESTVARVETQNRVSLIKRIETNVEGADFEDVLRSE